MLSFVTGIFRDCFTFAYDAYSSILVGDGISVWNVLLVVFVATLLLSGIARILGAPALGGRAASTYADVREAQKAAARQEQERHPLSYYGHDDSDMWK